MAFSTDVVGNWTGTYEVWFELGDPISHSPTDLTVDLAGPTVRFTYTWSFQDTSASGSYVIEDDGSLEFVDTFHTSGTAMYCTPNGPLDFTGTYEAEDKTWGWRTEFAMPGSDTLVVTGWNVSPDGEETKATEARYRRA